MPCVLPTRWERFVSILGTRVLRTEDPKFLTTGGEYTEDLVDERLAGAAHVFFVRSPLAHARITGIDLDAVRATPGVVAAYAAADLADLRPGLPDARHERRDDPAACSPPTRSGTSASRSRWSSPRTRTRARTRPSWSTSTTSRCPRWSTRATRPGTRRCCSPTPAPTPCCTFGRRQLDEHLFDGCEVVVTRTIVNQRVAPAPMETRAAAAVWGEDGRLTAWIPNQGAQGTKAALADDARARAGPGAGDHARRRRRLRGQVRRRPRARGGGLGGPGARPPGALDRDPLREPGRHDRTAGPRCRP